MNDDQTVNIEKRLANLFNPTAQAARFAALLSVLESHNWHRCDDHWRTPDNRAVDAWEAIEWASRVFRMETQQ